MVKAREAFLIDIAVTERAIKPPACPVAPGGDFSAVYTNTFEELPRPVPRQNLRARLK
jgi:hypothetical protein